MILFILVLYVNNGDDDDKAYLWNLELLVSFLPKKNCKYTQYFANCCNLCDRSTCSFNFCALRDKKKIKLEVKHKTVANKRRCTIWSKKFKVTMGRTASMSGC